VLIATFTAYGRVDMADMAKENCGVCNKDASPVSGEELHNLLREVGDWQLVEVDNVNQLRRVFKFKNFIRALTFTTAAGEIAESQGHHPTIITEWGKVTIIWWTHRIGGLHQNDFIMAAKTDALYENC